MLKVGLHKQRIPLTAVSGSFRSFLLKGAPGFSANPTNGSWWMVQILSTSCAHKKKVVQNKSVLRLGRKDLNNPPTSVGGIRE